MELSNITKEHRLRLLIGTYTLEHDGLWLDKGRGRYVTLFDQKKLTIRNLPLSVICFDIRATYFQWYINA